ncbi:non-hydrolyzing UDP-N-acetylglucosamine 2-epimerase [Actinomyces sp.]|uniref:non-hydrolyzing UDP-N-acetylglucosamine 2-epimerase n=1 Tax=Actinomyces sp. TaxID=29317 RepID=UPI001EC34D75|nr:UDP-N-acetylglucosamine 2-epimerase (non-hydrolyzing) [Actinomyces sp.]MBS5825883.1 UDP-N-acetylglucosamine 2-epimerase (non-hydrolyzing) [Actinomyces sp.]MDU4286175.1 UDP-N-acetylglucosamine 2-epimerase (non-hydrolyzing) [Actinomyces sp.]
MKIMSVVGARPQFVKLAPIAHACERAGVEHVIVHTGQHYDPMLSDVFFEELNIPTPDEHLGVGSGSHGVQTGAMLAAMDEVILKHEPDWVLVYGDTNSTLAAALSAVKLHFPIAHLEAGLRSFNREMPEEINRVLTDHAADLLLAPTEVGAKHLADEGLADRTVVVGDVMTDVLMETRAEVADKPSPIMQEFGFTEGEYSLATIHRPANTDTKEQLDAVLDSLGKVDHPVVILAHPRLVAKAKEHGLTIERGNLKVHAPLAYPDLVASTMHARGVITDSGGLQKEAFLLRTPCTTVRPQTEWVETTEAGWNVLVDAGAKLVEAASRPRPTDTDIAPYGNGHAAERVVQVLQKSSHKTK